MMRRTKRTKGMGVSRKKHKRPDGLTAHVHRRDAPTTGQGRPVLQTNSCQTIWGGRGAPGGPKNLNNVIAGPAHMGSGL